MLSTICFIILIILTIKLFYMHYKINKLIEDNYDLLETNKNLKCLNQEINEIHREFHIFKEKTEYRLRCLEDKN